MRRPTLFAVLPLALALSACGGHSEVPATDAAAPAGSDAAAPTPAGRTIEVETISDDKGNYFEPKKIEAHRGDVLKFTLVSGVHNVHFPADKNPGASGLPEPSELLQLPGQTLEIPVSFKPGKYFFQCDPHAALGMSGELDVDD